MRIAFGAASGSRAEHATAQPILLDNKRRVVAFVYEDCVTGYHVERHRTDGCWLLDNGAATGAECILAIQRHYNIPTARTQGPWLVLPEDRGGRPKHYWPLAVIREDPPRVVCRLPDGWGDEDYANAELLAAAPALLGAALPVAEWLSPFVDGHEQVGNMDMAKARRFRDVVFAAQAQVTAPSSEAAVTGEQDDAAF